MIQRLRVPLGFVVAAAVLYLAKPTGPFIIAGLPIALAGAILRALAASVIRKNSVLTTTGPYAWTRNPMVLASLTLLVSLGIWYQSTLFVAWGLVLVSPALLFFVKVYEERELEIRFGTSYLEYKARTPFLFPRRPGTKIG